MIGLTVDAAQADPLLYRGVNLESTYGLHKSSTLPGDPGASFFGVTEVSGGKTLPANIPGNSLFFLPGETANWASGSYDASGHRIKSSGGVTSNVESLRFIYVYPNFMQPANPHFRITSDLIVPVMVNVHANVPGNTGAGNGGGGTGDILWAPLAFVVGGEGNENVKWSNYSGVWFNFPSGHFSSSDTFNVGSNEYAFMLIEDPILIFPHLAGMYWNTQIDYAQVIRANNDFVVKANPAETALITGQPVSTYQTGKLLAINTDILFHVTPKLAIGPEFSMLDQLSNDTWNGSPVQNSGQFALGAGFGINYVLAHHIDVQVKYLRSFDVRNMPRYNVVIAKLGIPFEL
jgi:hypothetical protein